MALIRSCFRQGNGSCIISRDWMNICIKTLKISRYHAVSIISQNTSKQEMHSLATIDSTTPHVSLLGPSVRRLLDSYGLDRNTITPSGHKGQLLKGDVLKYIDENAKTEIKFTHILEVSEKIPYTDNTSLESKLGYIDLVLSSTRQALATQMVECKNTTPHTYSTIDCDVDSLLALCNKFQKYDQCVSINDFVTKAAALALRQVPGVNASWLDGTLVHLNSINIAITVNSPNGLITPVLDNADQLNVLTISKTIMELREKALSGTVKPEDLQNASFTISDLGGLGVKTFTAVINPPQSAVLAVGDCQATVNNHHKLSRVMNVTLCCDGRVIDEQLASKWLTVFKDLIEKPLQMGL